MMSPNRNLIHGLILSLLAVSTFCSLNKGIELAGLNNDDASAGNSAVNIIHEHRHLPANTHSISFWGRDIALITSFYRGPGEIYAAVPFIWAIRDRSNAMKFYTLFWAMLCIASIYALIQVLCDDLVLAALCALSVTTSPYLTSTIPEGFTFSGVIDVSVCCLALLCLVAAYRYRSIAAWYFSCALTGLSVGFAPQAAAFFIAWTLIVIWMRHELWMRIWSSEGRSALYRSIPLPGLGIAPMLLANLLNGWFSVKLIAANLGTTANGICNVHYLQNMHIRLHQLFELLDGDGNPSALGSIFWRVFLGTCIGLVFVRFAWARLENKPVEKTDMIPLAFLAVIFMLSPFTLFHLGVCHLFILMPLGLSAAAMLPRMSGDQVSRRLKQIVIVCLLLGICVNVGQIRRFWRTLDERGDYYRDTNAVYPLAGWLAEVSAKRVFLMKADPHIPSQYFSLYYLTDGSVELKDFSEASCLEGSTAGRYSSAEARSDRDSYFILDRSRGPEPEPKSFSLLKRLCSERGRRLEMVKIIKRRHGETAFEIYAIRFIKGLARNSPFQKITAERPIRASWENL
jgi:hypothetical protein